MRLLLIVSLLLSGLCIKSYGQVFKFDHKTKSKGVTLKTLANGNTSRNWKKLIEKSSTKPKSDDLIADALFVDFGKVGSETKEVNLTVGNVYEPTKVEVYFIGDTEFFSLDIGNETNFWYAKDSAIFRLPVLIENDHIKIKIRTNNLKSGVNKAFLAFKIDKQLVRVGLKSNVVTPIDTEVEDININLGFVEADSVEFTDYRFTNLEEYPMDFKFNGDSNAFVFMVNYDSIDLDSVHHITSTNDTTILSIAPKADILGDHYAEIIFENLYIKQKVYLTSRVTKVRGPLIWEDTVDYDKNLQLLSKELFTPNDTVFYQLKIYNDSDYDTLVNLNQFVKLQTNECLNYSFPETLMKPRESTLVNIPLYLDKSCDLNKKLATTMNLMILKDSSVVSQTITYDPFIKIREELLNVFPKELTFTANDDTVEIKVPYYNLGKNATYPDLKSFITEIEKPNSIDLFYYPPRIKGYHKGYVSIFLTPYDSIAFHQEHHEQYRVKIFNEELSTNVHLVQKPWTAIVGDYVTEIILALLLIVVIILGVLSPRIIKSLKLKWEVIQFKRKQKADIASIKRCLELSENKNLHSELEQILEDIEKKSVR
ncbi:hypothetical protein [Flammeovirga pacifica]|uniref:Uncharacterized protein n=1 Tax=Flammeovirga pacifica TaxID=915059 RepID=A0A1S1YSS2_FLAPC|nr:hypothetical protein [Flammeovirga pacifica]OHX64082.1 hypothetical protein NH26_20970 [Flammeovirga pacifica]